MAIGYNPTAVTEGLIYYIDPDNNRSYSGIGNTVYNLVNSGFGGTFVGLTTAPLDSTNTKTFYLSGNNYVSAPNNIALTNNFTISVWFKLSAYNNSSIISKWFADGSNAHRCWFIGSDSSVNAVVITLSSDGTYTNPTIKRYVVPVNLNEYTQLTITFASGTLLVYKNGVLSSVTKVLDGSFSTVFNVASRPIQIGYQFDGSAYYNLANVGITQIYNRVLSAAEILQNYNATKKRYSPEEQIVRDGLVLNLDPGNRNSYPGTGNTIYDLAGFGNTGTLVSATFSSLNNGSLSGVISKNSSVNSGQNFTVSAWIYPTAFGTRMAIVGNAYPYSTNAGWYFFIANSYFGLNQSVFFSAGVDQVSVGTISYLVSINKWNYVSASVTNGGASVKIYVNGIEATYGRNVLSNVSLDYSTNEFYVGKRHSSAGDNFGGNISQALIYNRALSAQEILQNYNATKNRFINVLPPVRDNLILELDAGNLRSYPGSGTIWYDLSGNNLNGTLTNGPTYSFSDSASSIVFDKTNDYVLVSDNSLLNTFTGMTLEVIVKYTSTSDQLFAQKWNYSGGSQGYTLEIYQSAIVGACYASGTAYLSVPISGYPINNVHHIVLRLSGNTQTMYINGISVATNNSGSVPSLSGTNFTIGQRSNLSGTYLGGNVYLAKFYNRALSAAEISQNFNFYRTRYGI